MRKAFFPALVLIPLAFTVPVHAAAPVVDSLTASSTTVASGGIVSLQVDAHDPDCPGTCTSGCGMTIRSDLTSWTADGGTFPSLDVGFSGSPYTSTAQWQAPATDATYTIQVYLADNGSFLCGGRQSTIAELQVQVVTPRDFGDAPDPTYPTLFANDGARHVAAGPMLGATRDPEIDGQPTTGADGDDTNDTDDEDGVVFTSPYAPGGTVSVEVTASAAGLLNAWVDFNQDGDWTDAGEQVFSDEPLAGGVNNLAFNVPAAASTTAAPFARFRLDTAGGLTPTGRAGDGEVEDHRIVESPPDNGGGGGGGGCGSLSPPGGGPSGPVQLLALGLLLAAMRRYWLARVV